MEMEDSSATEEHDSFHGREFIHLLSREITITIEDLTKRFEEGDSLNFTVLPVMRSRPRNQ